MLNPSPRNVKPSQTVFVGEFTDGLLDPNRPMLGPVVAGGTIVANAVDKTDMLPTRAKFYRAHRVHLGDAANYDVDVVTAGTLVADDSETPVGSIFVIDAKDRADWPIDSLHQGMARVRPAGVA